MFDCLVHEIGIFGNVRYCGEDRDNLRLLFVKVTVTLFSFRRSVGILPSTNSEKI